MPVMFKRYLLLYYSRESSRRNTPVHLRDDMSDTGSRISVTPLPSVKNSPRGSPVPVQFTNPADENGLSTIGVPKIPTKPEAQVNPVRPVS